MMLFNIYNSLFWLTNSPFNIVFKQVKWPGISNNQKSEEDKSNMRFLLGEDCCINIVL